MSSSIITWTEWYARLIRPYINKPTHRGLHHSELGSIFACLLLRGLALAPGTERPGVWFQNLDYLRKLQAGAPRWSVLPRIIRAISWGEASTLETSYVVVGNFLFFSLVFWLFSGLVGVWRNFGAEVSFWTLVSRTMSSRKWFTFVVLLVAALCVAVTSGHRNCTAYNSTTVSWFEMEDLFFFFIFEKLLK